MDPDNRECVDKSCLFIELNKMTNYNNVVQFYDKHAQIFEEKVKSSKKYGFIMDNIEMHIPTKSSRILDVGCGTGMFGNELKSRGYNQLDGLDGSATMLALANQKNIYNKLYQHIVSPDMSLPVDQSSYAVVTAIYSVGYPGNISTSALHTIVGALKPNGCLFISHNDNLIDGQYAPCLTTRDFDSYTTSGLIECIDKFPVHFDNEKEGENYRQHVIHGFRRLI